MSMPVNIILKNRYLYSTKTLTVLLKVQWIFCCIAEPFFIRNFKRVDLPYKYLCRNAERVHGQRKVGNSWSSSGIFWCRLSSRPL